jgi:hypothetical protein
MGGPGSGPRPDPWRRRRVAELRARGLTLAEIGQRLGLSRQLVHYYLRLAGWRVVAPAGRQLPPASAG